jgi:hypothetical protein
MREAQNIAVKQRERGGQDPLRERWAEIGIFAWPGMAQSAPIELAT